MQPTEKNYEKTQVACFVGYIVQAIVNNFVPLLFLTFQSQYGIPLSQITLLVTLNAECEEEIGASAPIYTEEPDGKRPQ